MSLVLEIEFLTGSCHAAREPGDDSPDWPPQPDRVFSALVSSWGLRGECPSERAALEWLEAQPPPAIHASDAWPRTTVDVYTPVNDARASSAPKKYLRVMPAVRPRQPRRFPVARPEQPIVSMVWSVDPSPTVLAALNAVAGAVGYLGRSASLVRCGFGVGEVASGEPARKAQRRIYPGRLRELELAYRLNPARPTISPGAPVVSQSPRLKPDMPFTNWLSLEVVEGTVPDLRASPLVCRALRDALIGGYRRLGLGNAIPEVVSGHAPDGKPTREAHLAIVPLAFVGTRHADGHVLGVAMIPPAGTGLESIPHFVEVFEALAPYCERSNRRVLELARPPLRSPVRFSPVEEGTQTKRSLESFPYLSPSRVWATVTPLVLDRHFKRKLEVDVPALVATACEHAGLPRPDPRRVVVQRIPPVVGAPPAKPLPGEPGWMAWKRPHGVASRPLVHAVVDFEQSIPGPVLIGAGRFTGLGLCRGIRL